MQPIKIQLSSMYGKLVDESIKLEENKMSEKTVKLLKKLELEKAKTEQLRKQVKAGTERNMFLKKQVENL